MTCIPGYLYNGKKSGIMYELGSNLLTGTRTRRFYRSSHEMMEQLRK